MGTHSAFSIHESAILLEAYLTGKIMDIPRLQLAKQVSDVLRKMAVNAGARLDDSYRNVPGIENRLISMECAYKGTNIASVRASGMFLKIVDLYKNNHALYGKILKEAMEMINARENQYSGVVNEFTLENIPDIEYSKPTSFIYNKRDRVYEKHWSDLYVAVLNAMSPEQVETLIKHFSGQYFFSNSDGMRRPYKIRPGTYVELNKSARNLIYRLKEYFIYCNIPFDSLCIEYEVKDKQDVSLVPDIIYKVIQAEYSNGIRFDETVIRLLNGKTGIEVNNDIICTLQKTMFRRSDGLFFLKNTIISNEESKILCEKIIQYLHEYPLCDVNILYRTDSLPGIRNVNDYIDFLQFLLPNTIRISTLYGFRIIRPIMISKNAAEKELIQNIIAMIKDKGCITEEELMNEYPVLTSTLLKKLLEKNADKVISTTINEILCYQTIETMGFDDEFSETLNDVITEVEELSLLPTQETLNVLLSIRMGQNFMDAYDIPDEKTFRHIIAMYYTGKKVRVWKSGSFVEDYNNV